MAWLSQNQSLLETRLNSQSKSLLVYTRHNRLEKYRTILVWGEWKRRRGAHSNWSYSLTAHIVHEPNASERDDDQEMDFENSTSRLSLTHMVYIHLCCNPCIVHLQIFGDSWGTQNLMDFRFPLG